MRKRQRPDAWGQFVLTCNAMDCGRARTDTSGQEFSTNPAMDRRKATTDANGKVLSTYRAMDSVSKGSEPSLRVRVRVQTELLRNWQSGLSITPNCPLGYVSMVNSEPVSIEWVVSGSPSRSIYRFI